MTNLTTQLIYTVIATVIACFLVWGTLEFAFWLNFELYKRRRLKDFDRFLRNLEKKYEHLNKP